jgi:hypothetical protein
LISYCQRHLQEYQMLWTWIQKSGKGGSYLRSQNLRMLNCQVNGKLNVTIH